VKTSADAVGMLQAAYSMTQDTLQSAALPQYVLVTAEATETTMLLAQPHGHCL
jgi:hypothetical protein